MKTSSLRSLGGAWYGCAATAAGESFEWTLRLHGSTLWFSSYQLNRACCRPSSSDAEKTTSSMSVKILGPGWVNVRGASPVDNFFGRPVFFRVR